MTSTSVSKELIEELDPIEVRDADHGRDGSHVDLRIDPGKVKDAARRLHDRGYFLEDLTAVDRISHREVVYRFNNYQGPDRITLRASAGDGDEIDTISDIHEGANWQERECFEFLGVTFKDHPNLIRLLLPEDSDFHPLRKDFEMPKEFQAPEYHQD